MQKGHNKVPIRSYRLTPELEDRWSEYLEVSGVNQNQAIKEALTAYLKGFLTFSQKGQ